MPEDSPIFSFSSFRLTWETPYAGLSWSGPHWRQLPILLENRIQSNGVSKRFPEFRRQYQSLPTILFCGDSFGCFWSWMPGGVHCWPRFGNSKPEGCFQFGSIEIVLRLGFQAPRKCKASQEISSCRNIDWKRVIFCGWMDGTLLRFSAIADEVLIGSIDCRKSWKVDGSIKNRFFSNE